MLPREEHCCGCGACANACPVNAIKMEYSSTGFLIPIIDNKMCIQCGKCEKVCPSLNVKKEKALKPRLYSFCADDAIRKESSSGGVFSLLAEYVLKKNGYVCGAAFDSDFQLEHRIISSLEDLAPIRSSKYLQSNTKNTYKQIECLLKNKKYVLFSGTPCQVAGLYTYLGKDYEELITVDVLCHGTPSQKYFDRYLKDISQGKKVKSVNFRDKKMGWNCDNIVIKFANDTEYIGRRSGKNPDAYINAFKGDMMSRKVCYDCQYAVFPRQGDFTIGDLWNSDRLDPKSNDGKGTSFVFLNSEKGERVFEIIKQSAKYVKEIIVEDYSRIPNRVYAKRKEHSGRRRFINLMKRKSFLEAYYYVKNEIYDIGMLGYMCNPNIGSDLTYYALYHVLTDMGYEVLPIERPKDSSLELSNDAVEFFKKWLPAYAQPVQSESILDMRKYNDICNMFVVGSDQIWLESSAIRRNHYCFGQWIDINKKKIAYATSFGGPGARGSQKFYRELEYYLNRFTKLSCREMNGVNFANNELNLNSKVELVLDPVFLANVNIYKKLVNSVKINRVTEYIGGYVIKPKPTFYSLVEKAKEYFQGLPVEMTGEPIAQVHTEKWGFVHKNNFPIEATLERIYNSKFFITDSYHGVCFCIIFRKDFLVIPRDFPDRFTTLLNRLELGDRIIKENHSNLTDKSFAPIDWNAVYERLQVEVGISRQWLKNALEDELHKRFSYTDVDVIMELIRKQECKIKELSKEIELLKADK